MPKYTIHRALTKAERAAECAAGPHAKVHRRYWARNAECPWCDTFPRAAAK